MLHQVMKINPLTSNDGYFVFFCIHVERSRELMFGDLDALFAMLLLAMVFAGWAARMQCFIRRVDQLLQEADCSE